MQSKVDQVSSLRNEFLDYIRHTPRVADAHARFMSEGGERLLELAVSAIRGDMFPWDQPQHVQAAYGAFIGGATWMAKLIRNAVVLAGNRTEALRMLAQMDGSITAQERQMLKAMYGYTDQELDAMDSRSGFGSVEKTVSGATTRAAPKRKTARKASKIGE